MGRQVAGRDPRLQGASARLAAAELLLDGLSPAEAEQEARMLNYGFRGWGWQQKSRREAAFPLDVVRAALKITVDFNCLPRAVVTRDKTHNFRLYQGAEHLHGRFAMSTAYGGRIMTLPDQGLHSLATIVARKNVEHHPMANLEA